MKKKLVCLVFVVLVALSSPPEARAQTCFEGYVECNSGCAAACRNRGGGTCTPDSYYFDCADSCDVDRAACCANPVNRCTAYVN